MIGLAEVAGSNVALALLAAITWGGGDFSGGMAVRRGGGSFGAAVRVVLLSHTLSFAALLILLVFRHDALPTGAPLLWGLAAGFFGGASVLAFYICLARGAMGASAAISGLLAAAIPSVVSTLLEGAPGVMRIAGFLLAAAAIWLVASTSDQTAAPPGTLALSILSGIGFGFYFVSLRMAGSAGVFWPLALSRSVSVSLCLACLFWLWLKRSDTLPASPLRLRTIAAWVIGTAVLDTAGNLFFIAATRAGRLDVASVLASLYPASTILLAAWLLRERPSGRQALGMTLAVVAVTLITL